MLRGGGLRSMGAERQERRKKVQNLVCSLSPPCREPRPCANSLSCCMLWSHQEAVLFVASSQPHIVGHARQSANPVHGVQLEGARLHIVSTMHCVRVKEACRRQSEKSRRHFFTLRRSTKSSQAPEHRLRSLRCKSSVKRTCQDKASCARQIDLKCWQG